MSDEQLPRIFRLNRVKDATGISGTGIVAQGVLSIDGSVAMRWLTEHRSWCIYDSILEVHAIHGHDGKTRIEFYEEGEWSRWQPKAEWTTSSRTKTGSGRRISLAPWETLPKKLQGRAKLGSKLLTDLEAASVERKLTTGPGSKRNRVLTDEKAADLEERMTRQSIVRGVQEATDSALKSRRFKY